MAEKMNSKTIVKSLAVHREEIRRFGVKRIGLFGSYLKGSPKKGSDLDFIVSFRDPTFDNYMDLKFFLESLFRKKVDLVLEGSLKPSLEHIKEQAVYA